MAEKKPRSVVGCLVSFLVKFLIALVVIVGVAIFLTWLILRPTTFKVHVNDASLTKFNFTTTNTLQYKLSLNMAIRNPNKKIAIYFDEIHARAYYDGQRFDTESLTKWGFKSEHKSTTILKPVFEGQNLVVLGADQLSEFYKEKSAGVYGIEMKFNLRIRFRIGDLITGGFKPKVKCDLEVPFSSNGKSAGRFETTKCDVNFF